MIEIGFLFKNEHDILFLLFIKYERKYNLQNRHALQIIEISGSTDFHGSHRTKKKLTEILMF